MTLRLKILILLVCAYILLIAASFVVQWKVVNPGFQQIEYAEAQNDLDRCQEALWRDCEHLADMTKDWAVWDDTYQFIQDKNEKFRMSNLSPAAFPTARVNLIAFIRPSGEMVWGEIRDLKTTEPIEVPGFLAGIANAKHPLVANALTETSINGVLITDKVSMLVASHPIMTSENKGPVRGAMVMGRLLSESEMEDMAKRTRVNMKFIPIDSITSMDDKVILSKLLLKAGNLVLGDDPDKLYGYAIVKDIFKNPALLLQAQLDRRISHSGATVANIVTAGSLVGGLSVLIILWIALSRMVIRPLSKVTRHAMEVGRQEGLKARLNMINKDEIGQLARELDRLADAFSDSVSGEGKTG